MVKTVTASLSDISLSIPQNLPSSGRWYWFADSPFLCFQGTPLAREYSRAMLRMLPKTSYPENVSGKTELMEPHEPINDIPVHRYTMQQLFLPTAESRHFTREDAAKAFHPHMLSADARSPHPELIQMEKEMQGIEPSQNQAEEEDDARMRFRKAAEESEQKLVLRRKVKEAQEKKSTKTITTERFEFRFKNINAEQVGLGGRGRKGIGWRYGTQFEDRKKGHSRVPTRVP